MSCGHCDLIYTLSVFYVMFVQLRVTLDLSQAQLAVEQDNLLKAVRNTV